MNYLPAYDHDNGWKPFPGAGGAEPETTPKTLYYLTDGLGNFRLGVKGKKTKTYDVKLDPIPNDKYLKINGIDPLPTHYYTK